jgi:hypothetical protein
LRREALLAAPLVLCLSLPARVLRTRVARCPLPLVRAPPPPVDAWPSLLALVALAVLSASRRGAT